MLAFKLAWRNLTGAGLRTWLNVFVLSLSYVIIIWYQGFIDGWNRDARNDMIAWEIGGGQYWHHNYDPYDAFTISESHAPLPSALKDAKEKGEITPLLITQATIYPEGRLLSIMLKGLEHGQNIIKIPTSDFQMNIDEIPAIIGTRLAKSINLKVGDYVTVRWRDANGTFDAADMKIVQIFKTTVPSIDNGQIYVPLSRLQQMMQMPGEATLLISSEQMTEIPLAPGWEFRDHDYLLQELDAVIQSKSAGGAVMYLLLMTLALLAIFDTQVLSIFRRQKEIGTDIALGMTRGQVVKLFTIEGTMHAILAVFLAAVYGIPFLWFQAVHGWAMPQATDDYGLAIAEKIFPMYSVALVIGTILLVLTAATIVSYLPARRITKMNPTDAIRGKIQ